MTEANLPAATTDQCVTCGAEAPWEVVAIFRREDGSIAGREARPFCAGCALNIVESIAESGDTDGRD